MFPRMCSFTSDSQILSPLIHIHHLLLPDIRQNSSTFSDVNLDGSIEIEAPPAASVLEDPDHDGVENEIPTSIVDFMEFYLELFQTGNL